MNQKIERTTAVLTYAGVLPFLFLSMAVAMKFPGWDYSLALRGYGAMIASFLCGIHWATYLFFPDQCRRNLLVTSNVITLIVYGSLFPALQAVALIMQSLCFITLLFIDYELLKRHLIPVRYFNLRRNATIVVVLLLGVVSFI